MEPRSLGTAVALMDIPRFLTAGLAQPGYHLACFDRTANGAIVGTLFRESLAGSAPVSLSVPPHDGDAGLALAQLRDVPATDFPRLELVMHHAHQIIGAAPARTDGHLALARLS